jgi:predicted ATPase
MAAHAALGYFDRSGQAHADGAGLAQRIDHAPSRANTLWRRAEALAVLRDVPRVRELASEAIVLTETHGLRQPRPIAQCYHGWAIALTGDPAAGIAEIETGLATLESFGARINASCMSGLYAEALGAAGRHAEALTQVETGLALGTDYLEIGYNTWLHRIRGELLLHLSSAAEATAAFREGLAIARAQEAKGFELTIALPLARLEANAGRRDAARDLLAPLCAWFTEGLDEPHLVEAKALLDELG